MRERFDEDQVGLCYAALQKCVVLLDQHLRRCVALLGNPQTSPPTRLVVAPSALKEAVEGLQELKSVEDEAGRLLKPLEAELPALVGEPVKSANLTGASWAEVTMAHCERYTRDLGDWRKVKVSDDSGLRRLIGRVTDCMPDVPRLRADLKIEEAKLRERARAMSPEVRYAYEFLHLEPQSRRLFDVLTRNRGRWVEYQTIAVEVCDDPRASNDRINKATSRLKAELRTMGSTRVADSIESQRGAYRLP